MIYLVFTEATLAVTYKYEKVQEKKDLFSYILKVLFFFYWIAEL